MTIKTFTPIQLWKDFDDTLSNEAVNIVSYSVTDSYTTIELFFNALIAADGAVRAYVKLYYPTGGTILPTILFIPDARYYDAESEMIKMTSYGFCTATFDYAGMEELATTYPPSLSYGKLCNARDHVDTANYGADQTAPYLWSKISRRVISLLCTLPYVDFNKIAVVSSNFGANMLMQVASMDKRVKAAVSIFNNCSAVSGDGHPDEIERNRWEIGCSMQSYAKFLNCKLLMALGTNNHDYDYLRTNDTIALLPENTPCFISASIGSDVCLKSTVADTIITWIGDVFAGGEELCKAPTIAVKKTEDGELHLLISADAAYDGIRETVVALSYGNEQSRFRKWKVQPTPTNIDGKGQTTVQFYNHDDPIYAFVNVIYKGGSVYTSQVIKITQLDLLDLEPYSKSDRIIYERKMGIFPFNTESKQMFAPHNNLSFKIGAREIAGISVNTGNLSTYNISDMSNVDDNTMLQFDCFCAKAAEFEVVLTDCDGREYIYAAAVDNKEEWSKIVIEMDEFKDSALVQLKQWRNIKKLSFRGAFGVMFNNILWV